jgi:phage terminase large subunit
MDITVDYIPNAKQSLFHSSNADELVYGGAKGGGKSCSLVMEALAYALEYPGAEMYIFRETYDDLEANIIREWKEKVPKELYTYREGKYQATLINGSSVKFRYIQNFADAEGYQGRSMDWIGVDELTKHEERSIQVLLSCLRSPKGYPPRFRGTCNPGGIGHTWVKERYIEATNYGDIIITDSVTGSTIQFIPAKVYDNDVLMKNDPKYVKRLENLPESQKKAFLYGDWDIFEGQYFNEFSRDIHTIDPFVIPEHWNRYVTFDYGLDMFACLFIAVDTHENAYAYKEIHQNELIVSDAAKKLKEMSDAGIKYKDYFAPPDLWNRRNDTGKSAFEIFDENGIYLTKSSNNRIAGWYSVKEYLKVHETKHEQTGEVKKTARLKIFKNCTNLINYLPQLQYDDKDPNDCATQPHHLTHICDALRYFCVSRPITTKEPQEEKPKWMQKLMEKNNRLAKKKNSYLGA